MELQYNSERVTSAKEKLKIAKDAVNKISNEISSLFSSLKNTKGMDDLFSQFSSLSSGSLLKEESEELESIHTSIEHAEEEITQYSKGSGEQTKIFLQAILHPEQFPDIISNPEFSAFKEDIEKTFPNVEIQEYNGKLLFVPKSYIVSLEELQETIDRNHLKQSDTKGIDKNGKAYNIKGILGDKCPTFSSMFAIGLLSNTSYKILHNPDSYWSENRKGRVKGIWGQSTDQLVNNPIESFDKEEVWNEMIKEVLEGRPCKAKVNINSSETGLQIKGEKHVVTPVALTCESIFRAYNPNTQTIDSSKITTEDVYIVDCGIGKIASMKECNRDLSTESLSKPYYIITMTEETLLSTKKDNGREALERLKNTTTENNFTVINGNSTKKINQNITEVASADKAEEVFTMNNNNNIEQVSEEETKETPIEQNQGKTTNQPKKQKREEIAPYPTPRIDNTSDVTVTTNKHI